MPARFTVLASGSSGNASLLQLDDFGLLVDCGLGPHALAERLAAAGASWKAVNAVVLTHTHGDHWNPLTLAHLRRLNVPLIAHPRHHEALSRHAAHDPLRRAGLAREYQAGEWFDVHPTLAALPIPIPHDADPTFAFRFEAKDGLFGSAWAVGYASDLGHCPGELLAAFDGVDVLALEYNHDEGMQRASRRPRILVDRVLGSHGHLSNRQAADVTRAVAAAAGPDGLRALVQLHLSRDCNDAARAARAGRDALAEHAPGAAVVTAVPFAASPAIVLATRTRRVPTVPRREDALPRQTVQPLLPGMSVTAGPAAAR